MWDPSTYVAGSWGGNAARANFGRNHSEFRACVYFENTTPARYVKTPARAFRGGKWGIQEAHWSGRSVRTRGLALKHMWNNLGAGGGIRFRILSLKTVNAGMYQSLEIKTIKMNSRTKIGVDYFNERNRKCLIIWNTGFDAWRRETKKQQNEDLKTWKTFENFDSHEKLGVWNSDG